MSESAKTEHLPLYHLGPGRRALPVVQRHDCVVALKALAEDTRVSIIGLLIEEPLGVGDIAKRLSVSQYNVSKHLRILREAGLLEVEKQGRARLYALPAAIRRQGAAGDVLDLGCCSFQFDPSAPKTPPPRASSARRRPRSTSRRRVPR